MILIVIVLATAGILVATDVVSLQETKEPLVRSLAVLAIVIVSAAGIFYLSKANGAKS